MKFVAKKINPKNNNLFNLWQKKHQLKEQKKILFNPFNLWQIKPNKKAAKTLVCFDSSKKKKKYQSLSLERVCCSKQGEE